MLCVCCSCEITDVITQKAQCSHVASTCVKCERPCLVTKVGPNAYEGAWMSHGVSFRIQGRSVRVDDTWFPMDDIAAIVERWQARAAGKFVQR